MKLVLILSSIAAALVALLLIIAGLGLPNNKTEDAQLRWLSAGVSGTGYQKPGAAVVMQFALPQNLRPGAADELRTRWQISQPADQLVIDIIADPSLTVSQRSITIKQPAVGENYPLNFSFSTQQRRHTLGFIATTVSGGSRQSRSFAIAIETDDAAKRQADSIDTVNGEKLHRMVPSRTP